jgi:hypothetical protein
MRYAYESWTSTKDQRTEFMLLSIGATEELGKFLEIQNIEFGGIEESCVNRHAIL